MQGVSFPWLSPLCILREPWSQVVASPGRYSVRTSQCLYSLSSKVWEASSQLIRVVSAVCLPVTHSSVNFPVLVLVLHLLYLTKDKCPLVAVCLQASGAQHQGHWDTAVEKDFSQHLTWRTMLLDARSGDHPQPLNAQGEERKWFWKGAVQ